MQERISGPHFCFNTAQKVAHAIFNDLLKECGGKDGSISYGMLKERSEKFADRASSKFLVFEEIYDDCMATAKRRPANNFTRKNLPVFVVFTYTADLTKEIFATQSTQSGKDWNVYFSESLLNYSKQFMEYSIVESICQEYINLAIRKGRDISAREILLARNVAETMNVFFETLIESTMDKEGRKTLCSEINKYLSVEFQLTGPNRLQVTGNQIDEFVNAIKAEPIRNPFRRRAKHVARM